MNTAIASGDDYERGKLIVGNYDLYKALHEIEQKNTTATTIVLAHHGLDMFSPEEKKKVSEILDEHRVALYLCGDAHEVGCNPIGVNTVEVTMGCMKIKQENGVQTQAAFSVGELEDGYISIKTYQFDSQHPGWGPYMQFDKKLERLLRSRNLSISQSPNHTSTYYKTSSTNSSDNERTSGIKKIFDDSKDFKTLALEKVLMKKLESLIFGVYQVIA